MLKIRRGVFETNSSSTHSISIGDGLPPSCSNLTPEEEAVLRKLERTDYLLDRSLTPGCDGVLRIDANKEFGWEVEDYQDAATKAMYCYIDQYQRKDRIKMLKEVLMEQTKATDVEFRYEPDSGYGEGKYGYIDHQSDGTSDDAFIDKETLRNFIFNQRSILRIDNDNR